MEAPEIPVDERERLEALRRYEVLDTLPEQDYDDLAQLAAYICGTPIALVSLVDEDRQWFKARVGLDAEETPRDVSFCGHVVGNRSSLIVPDASQDARFADNPLVVGEPDIRFYAGMPLVTPTDRYLGTLCVIDREPRQLTPAQLAAVERLSRQVVQQLELRLSMRQLQAARDEIDRALRAEREASAAKSHFLANMSHELRTPLNAVIGYSEMLIEEGTDLDATQAAGDLMRIRNAGKHLLRLINDVLDLSKIEAGRLELVLGEVDVQAVVDEAAQVITPVMLRNGNELTVQLPDDIGTMHCDPKRLTQCLLNLLSNAAKFTEDGQVTLTVSAVDGGLLEFAVKDTGKGLSDEAQARLFQRFVQIETGPLRKDGAGLGLSLSQDLARMMGGSITVDSTLGEGSTFRLTLPRSATAADAGPRAASS